MTNAFLIGNGESRKGLDLNTLKPKGKVFGCNAIYRDFTPDVLISVDHGIMHEIYHNGYALKNECWFRDWNKLPGMMYEPLVEGQFDKVYQNERGESQEFVMHGSNMAGEVTIMREDKTTYKKNVNQSVCKISWIEEDKVNDLNSIMPNGIDIGWASGSMSGFVACKTLNPTHVYLIGQDLVSETDSVNNMYKGSLYYKVPEAKPVPPNQWIQQWLTLFNDYPDVKFFKVNPKEGKASQKLNEWKMCKNLTYIKLSELDEHIK
jgi:hypothetical protein